MHDTLLYFATGASALGALVSVIVTIVTYKSQKQLEARLRSKSGFLAQSVSVEEFSKTDKSQNVTEADKP